MGGTTAINIEVHIDLDAALEIADEIITWLDLEVADSQVHADEFYYDLEWPDHIDSEDDKGLQRLHIEYSRGQSEYLGVGTGEKLVIHYSPYYSEDSIDSFGKKTAKMRDILERIQEITRDSVEIDDYVTICTI